MFEGLDVDVDVVDCSPGTHQSLGETFRGNEHLLHFHWRPELNPWALYCCSHEGLRGLIVVASEILN